MSDDLTRIAYHAWRSAQRGSEVPEAEFEATYSRLEAGWMEQVATAVAAQVRAQIAGEIETLAEIAEAKRDEHRERALIYLVNSDARNRYMATALAFRNQADGLRSAAAIARGDAK